MKLTAIRCDYCYGLKSNRNWSRLWRDARRDGWVLGRNRNEHFCSDVCLETFEKNRQAAEEDAR